MNLNPKALGLTAGILSAVWWFLAMSVSLFTGIGSRTLSTFGSYHPWFSYSWGGAVWIAVLHLITGFVVGWLFATVYNKLAK